MIDPSNNELLPLQKAAELVESNRAEHVDESTVRRWARVGLYGVKLEVVSHRLGARTSQAMLSRFLDRIAAVRTARRVDPPLLASERIKQELLKSERRAGGRLALAPQCSAPGGTRTASGRAS